MSKPPLRRPNTEARGGVEHLTEDQVEAMIRVAGRTGRNGPRDAAMILIAYTHGLRASELVGLRWERLNQKNQTIYIQRSKGSTSGVHSLRDREVKALAKLRWKRSGPVFTAESGGPLGRNSLHKIVARAGRLAGIGLPVHSHMLRHSCGFRLTNLGIDIRVIQDWLGHVNIQHTVLYTKLSATRFAEAHLWDD